MARELNCILCGLIDVESFASHGGCWRHVYGLAENISPLKSTERTRLVVRRRRISEEDYNEKERVGRCARAGQSSRKITMSAGMSCCFRRPVAVQNHTYPRGKRHVLWFVVAVGMVTCLWIQKCPRCRCEVGENVGDGG